MSGVLITVLGIDETRRGKPRWTRDQVSGRWVRTDPWDTGFVDLTGDQGLLGQVEGRTSAAVRQWLGEQTQAFQAGVTHVVIDPSTPRPPTPPRSPRRYFPTPCWSSTTSIWSSSPTTR